MITQINNTTHFDGNQNLSKQTPEFQQWYNEKVNPLINDTLKPDLLDEFQRPKSYTVVVDSFSVTIVPQYLNSIGSDWGCSDFFITIKTV